MTVEPSFIQAARRKQLVDCAVAEIAEVGLARASTVRIARRAGVSRGVLTYHFRDRAELVDMVVQAVYDLGAEILLPKIKQAATPREALMLFIGESVRFYAEYPQHMAALSAVFADHPRAHDARHSREMTELAQLLRAGQQKHQFRKFDVDIMAATIRSALDGALAHVVKGGAVEPYATELQSIFDAATARTKA